MPAANGDTPTRAANVLIFATVQPDPAIGAGKLRRPQVSFGDLIAISAIVAGGHPGEERSATRSRRAWKSLANVAMAQELAQLFQR